MKRKVVIPFVILIGLTNCSKAEETFDTLNSASCITTLTRLSNNEDDLSCSELNKELDKIERDCGRFINASNRESIALLRATCEDQ